MRTLLAVLAVVALTPLTLAPTVAQGGPGLLAVGDSLPAFSGTTVDGESWDSKTKLGRGLAVVWFLPDGGPTLKEMAKAVDPALFIGSFSRLTISSGSVRFVGVVRWEDELGGDDPDAEKLPLPVLQDPNGEIARVFGTPRVDCLTAFVADPGGRIAARVSGEDWRVKVREALDVARRRVREVPEEVAAALVSALRKQAAAWKLEPAPQVTCDGRRLTFSWRVREYMVYPRDRHGRWTKELRKETGPEHNGILVTAWIEWAGFPFSYSLQPYEAFPEWGGAELPALYWKRFMCKTGVPGVPLVLWARFDIGDCTSPALVTKVASALKASTGKR